MVMEIEKKGVINLFQAKEKKREVRRRLSWNS